MPQRLLTCVRAAILVGYYSPFLFGTYRDAHTVPPFEISLIVPAAANSERRSGCILLRVHPLVRKRFSGDSVCSSRARRVQARASWGGSASRSAGRTMPGLTRPRLPTGAVPRRRVGVYFLRMRATDWGIVMLDALLGYL